MMLNLMESVPARRLRISTARSALHVMIEAKKLAYADMLRYVGDPAVRAGARGGDAGQGARAEIAPARIDAGRAARDVEPSVASTA